MSVSPTTHLTRSQTPTHLDSAHTHNLRSKRAKGVTFSPESEFRMASANSLDGKHTVTIVTGTPFETSPEVRKCLSPRTICRIEAERAKLGRKESSRLSPQAAFERAIYSPPKRVQYEEQSSLWFPIVLVSFGLYLITGIYSAGETTK